jgi:hypothetical protein
MTPKECLALAVVEGGFVAAWDSRVLNVAMRLPIPTARNEAGPIKQVSDFDDKTS